MILKRISYFHYFLTAFALGLTLSIHSSYQEGQLFAGSAYETTLLILNLFAVGVIVICALGLIGNLLTAIQQNRRSLGIHLAVGAKPGDILRLVLLDTVLKRAILPVLLGGAGSQLFAASPIPKLFTLPFSPSLGNTVWCILASLAFLLLCALYPAVTAARVHPAEAWKGEGI